MTAEIFVTGLSETDTVTCTKDGKTKQGKWVEREVTVYNENLIPAMTSSTEPKGVASASSEYTDSNNNNKAWKALDRTHTDGWDQWSSSYGATLPQWIQYKFDSPVTINGMKLCNLADYNSDTRVTYGKTSTGYVSISNDGENFTKIQEFSVPVTTVDSPSEVQFSKSYTAQYVRVYLTSYNNTYSSSTCRIALLQFMGYETSTKQGWLFDKLKEYGAYTITATSGTDTVTQDVLVDMATQYNIEMSYKLYLYNLGDECESVTGGWQTVKWRGGLSSLTANKKSDHLYSKGVSNTASYSANFGWSTSNKVDLTGYDTLKAKISGGDYYYNMGARIGVSDTKKSESTNSSTSSDITFAASTQMTTIIKDETNFEEVSVDISSIAGSQYICAYTNACVSGQVGLLAVYAVWLE